MYLNCVKGGEGDSKGKEEEDEGEEEEEEIERNGHRDSEVGSFPFPLGISPTVTWLSVGRTS